MITKAKSVPLKTICCLGLGGVLASCAATGLNSFSNGGESLTSEEEISSFGGLPNAAADLNRPSVVSSFADLSSVVGPVDPVAALSSSLPSISKATADAYLAFAPVFLKAAASMRTSDASANFSLMDAFFDLGIDANLSEGQGQKNILSYFGGSTLKEINAAAKELRPLLTVVDEGEGKPLKGSALLGALFVGRALYVDGSRSDIAEILEDDYGVYVFHDDPVLGNVNLFLDEKTPKSYFTPLLMDGGDQLPEAGSDESSKTVLSLSAFDYIAQSPIGGLNRSAYDKGAQMMDYRSNDGAVSSVPFGYDGSEGKIYKGDGFTAAETSLGMTLFKPDMGISPWDFADGMAGGVLHGGEWHEITSKIPYFRTETKSGPLSLGTYGEGVFSAFVGGVDPQDTFLVNQKNDATFSPEGFVSHSVTFTMNYTSSSPYSPYEFVLDSPFAYRADLSATLAEGGTVSLPLSVGVVETPNYSE